MHKFLNNSVFDNTIKSNRKKRDVRIVTNVNKRSEYISRNLRMFELSKNYTKMDTSMSIGQSTLNVSKILLHLFFIIIWWQNGLKNVQRNYMATDSLVTLMETDNFL